MSNFVILFGVCSSAREVPLKDIPDSKVRGANMGPTWVLSAPDGTHVGPMNLAIRVVKTDHYQTTTTHLKAPIACLYFIIFGHHPSHNYKVLNDVQL